MNCQVCGNLVSVEREALGVCSADCWAILYGHGSWSRPIGEPARFGPGNLLWEIENLVGGAKDFIPDKRGFLFCLFRFNGPDKEVDVGHVSNVKHENLVALVEDLLKRLKAAGG